MAILCARDINISITNTNGLDAQKMKSDEVNKMKQTLKLAQSSNVYKLLVCYNRDTPSSSGMHTKMTAAVRFEYERAD